MDNRIVLVLGGARSGKSEFAEQLMLRSKKEKKGYIATCRVLDDEMKYRVILHRQRRPDSWSTYEILENAGSRMHEALDGSDALLFDCITMYVSNILMSHIEKKHAETLDVEDLEKLQNVLNSDLDQIFSAIGKQKGKDVIFVSDELGMGIVPGNAMSRVYRDLVGLANQYIAARAKEVYLSVAGITIELKRREVHL